MNFSVKKLAGLVLFVIAMNVSAEDDGCRQANTIREQVVAGSISASMQIAQDIIKEPSALEFIESCIPDLLGGFSFKLPNLADLVGKAKAKACGFASNTINDALKGTIDGVTGKVQSVLDATDVVGSASGGLIGEKTYRVGDINDANDAWKDVMRDSQQTGLDIGVIKQETWSSGGALD